MDDVNKGTWPESNSLLCNFFHNIILKRVFSDGWYNVETSFCNIDPQIAKKKSLLDLKRVAFLQVKLLFCYVTYKSGSPKHTHKNLHPFTYGKLINVTSFRLFSFIILNVKKTFETRYICKC